MDINGGYWAAPGGVGNAAYGVSAGIGYESNGFKLGGSIGTGNIGAYGAGSPFVAASSTASPKAMLANASYTATSVYALAPLGANINLQAGVVRDWGTDTANDGYSGATLFEGGLYWNPKPQFTAGIDGQYQSGGTGDGSYTASFVTVVRF